MASKNNHDSNVLDVDTPRLPTTTSVPQEELRSDTPHELPKSQSQPHHEQEQEIPFWNVNLPPSQHTKECPPYLQYALDNEKDRGILSTPDELYKRQTWEEVQSFIKNNRLDLFQRVPSDLRLYRQYCAKLVEEYGSVMNFVINERLGWSDLTPSPLPATGNPFDNQNDYKILYNDWPYGVDERITHLVVWTKFSLPPDPKSELGDISPETRQMIQDFVDDIFGTQDVIWFLNWASLKSIHSVEHFHVMLLNADRNYVDVWTEQDVPLYKKIKDANQLQAEDGSED